jgi:pimeloyl-ACP methyl ester carboxylesterase
MEIETFRIETADEVISDLKQRIRETRWPDEIQDSGWEGGADLGYMKELLNYWRDKYDWKKHESNLNRFTQFRSDIDDITIHYIHEKGQGPEPFPIILTHGWPDCFLRFGKLIPMLTDPEHYGADPVDSFDVVVPDIPGYGYSGRPAESSNIFKLYDTWNELMVNVLGYQRYGAHGGDWGSLVTEHLARSHAAHVAGIHLTDVPFVHTFQKPGDLSNAEENFLAANNQWMMKEGAYAMIQGTRPETLAYGLNDSPAGLAAWIIEKFQSMSGGGNIEDHFTKDELLTNISVYWITETIASSFLPYYATTQAAAFTWIGEKIKEWAGSGSVPAGFAIFPHDNSHPPREWAERFFNVQKWTAMPRGGHFAAMEEPELLAQDIRDFFRPLRKH